MLSVPRYFLSVLPRIIFLLMLLLFPAFRLWGQGNLLLGQYQELLPYYNPATIGQTDEYILRVVHNRQNEGISGSAKSFLLMGEAPLQLWQLNHSLGLQMSNETIGLFTETELALRYAQAYKLWGGRMQWGLQLMMHNSSFDGDKIYIPTGVEGMQAEDEALPRTKVTGKAVDAQLGLFFRRKQLSLGLSVMHLFAPQILLDRRYKVDLPRRYTLFMAYDLGKQSDVLSWTPSLLGELTDMGQYRVDTSLETKYKNRYFAHALYRLGRAWGAGVGIRLGRAKLGYHFEMPTTLLRTNNWGTHELMLTYSFPIVRTDRSSIYKSVRLL